MTFDQWAVTQADETGYIPAYMEMEKAWDAAIKALTAGVSVEPELPAGQMPVDWDIGYYTPDQLTTAIAAARVQALEEAAKVAEGYIIQQYGFGEGVHTKIRALIGEKTC